MNTRGTHLLADLHGCDSDLLDNVGHIETAMLIAAKDAGCVVISSRFHHFAPQGVTGLLLIAESHLSVHTWPERGYAAVDLYTCGTADTRGAVEHLARTLGADRIDWLTVDRGLPHSPALAAGDPETTLLPD